MQKGGKCIRRRCHHIADFTGGWPKTTGNPAHLRGSNGRESQHAETLSNGARSMRHDNSDNGHSISYWCYNLGIPLHEQSGYICTCDLVYGHHTSARPRLRYILQRPEPGQTDNLRTRLPAGQNMVCSSNIPSTGQMSTAIKHHDIMVHLARGHIQFPIHPPAWEDGRRWDLVNMWAKSRTLFLYRLQA